MQEPMNNAMSPEEQEERIQMLRSTLDSRFKRIDAIDPPVSVKPKHVPAPSEGKRKPAKGFAMGDSMWETEAFAKRRAKNRKAAKIAKAARRKNRK